MESFLHSDESEDPSTQNGYNYANGNPNRYVDSNGEAGQLSLSQLNKGVATKFTGGDGKSKVLLEVKGYTNTGSGVKSGMFEYILDHEGYVTHQTFIERDYYLRGGWGSRNKK